MIKKIHFILLFLIVLSSFQLNFAYTTPSWESWNPDLSSQGVFLSEEFTGYRYNPDEYHGGTLTIATPSDPPEQHQWNAGSTASYDFLDPMSDYLVRIDPKTGGPVPWIAESWEISEDKMTYTVHLTKGVKFHDGTELTSEDVKWCYDFVVENEFNQMSKAWQYLDQDNPTDIVDKYTIKFNLKAPFVSFVYDALTIVAIVPKNIWENIVSKPEFDWLTYVPSFDEQIGCGPFKLVDYVPNAWYKFEAFDDYWHGKPYLDEIVRPIITSGDAELLAVKRGDVEVFTGFLASEAIPDLLRAEGIGLYLYNNPYMYHWGMNTAKWPFSVKEFRLALAHAIDKQDLVDTLLLGYGLPGTLGVEAPFYDFWYNPNVPETYTYNIEKANQILDNLGWVDTNGDGVREGTGIHHGEPLAFDIGPPIYDPVRCRAAELLSQWFAQIGVDATIQYMEWATLWAKIIQPLDAPTKIDTWILGSSQSSDPGWMQMRLHSDNIPNPNYYGFANAEYDELALLQGTQFDTQDRQESIWRMQEILAEEVPLVVLYFRQSPSVYRTDKFTGWIDAFDSGRGHFWDLINVHLKEGGYTIPYEEPPENEFKIDLQIKTGDYTSDISLGSNPDATNDFDMLYDSVAPPSPPIGIDAYLWYPSNPTSPVNLRKLTEGHQNLEYSGEWILKIETIGIADQTTITWSAMEIATIPTDYRVELITPTEIVDMRSDYSYSWITNEGSLYEFTIKISSISEITLELTAGWNLISIPLERENNSASSIFGDISFYQLVEWTESGYQSSTIVEPNKAYWLLVLDDTTVSISGRPILSMDLDLQTGWNMIGGPGVTIDAKNVFDSYYQLIAWDGRGYVLSETFQPKQGYWALVLEDTIIHIGDIQ